MTSTVASKLFSQVIPDDVHSKVKVTVVGAGKVGMAVAFSLLLQVIL